MYTHGCFNTLHLCVNIAKHTVVVTPAQAGVQFPCLSFENESNSGFQPPPERLFKTLTLYESQNWHSTRLDGLMGRSNCLARLPFRKADIGTHLQYAASQNAHRPGFHAPGLRDMARAVAMHRHGRCVACLAMVRRDRRRLPQRISARFDIRSRAQNDMTAGHFISVKPPIVWLRDFGAQVIVVGIAGAGEHRPTAGKFIDENMRFSAAQNQTEANANSISPAAV